jgi:hypothetical protein
MFDCFCFHGSSCCCIHGCGTGFSKTLAGIKLIKNTLFVKTYFVKSIRKEKNLSQNFQNAVDIKLVLKFLFSTILLKFQKYLKKRTNCFC